jgi:hypothetical protein
MNRESWINKVTNMLTERPALCSWHGQGFFSSPLRPDRLREPPSLSLVSTFGSFTGGKAAEAWSWPLTSIQCRGLECVELHIHSRYISVAYCLNSGDACYHSVQNILSSRLVPKNLKIKIYKTVILPVVLYGCETWSLTLGEEHGLRVFKNRVLRRIFWPKREEDGSWGKLHNDEFHSLCTSPNIVSGGFF